MHAHPKKTTLEVAQETVRWVQAQVFPVTFPSAGVELKSEALFGIRSRAVASEGTSREETLTKEVFALNECMQSGVGACYEMALLGMAYVRKNYPEFRLHCVEMKGEDHVLFNIIPADLSDKDKMVLCDPWGNIACLWSEKRDAMTSLDQRLHTAAKKYIAHYCALMHAAVAEITEAQLTEGLLEEGPPIWTILENAICELLLSSQKKMPTLFCRCLTYLNKYGPIQFFNWSMQTGIHAQVVQNYLTQHRINADTLEGFSREENTAYVKIAERAARDIASIPFFRCAAGAALTDLDRVF